MFLWDYTVWWLAQYNQSTQYVIVKTHFKKNNKRHSNETTMGTYIPQLLPRGIQQDIISINSSVKNHGGIDFMLNIF